MRVRKEFDLDIDEKEIIRLLGYKNSEPEEEVLEPLRDELRGFKTYIKPEICYKKIYIRSIEKDRVTLENSIVFEGEFIANKLKGCSYVMVLISNIGGEIDNIIKSAFDEEDYLKGMIVDNIGTTSLGYINKIFWNGLIDELKGTNIGITQRLSPGDTAWPVNEQKKIFDCFEKTKLSVELLESSLMLPVKSTSAVFGFGEGIGITKLEHICSECSMKSCSYRMDKNVEVKVRINNDIKVIKAFKGQNLLQLLVENGSIIENPCNGKGTCGKCGVLIVDETENVSNEDKLHLSAKDIEKGIRLACAYKIVHHIEVRLSSKSEHMEILTLGEKVLVTVNPSVRKEFLQLKLPTIQAQRDDLQRIKDELKIKDINLSNKTLYNLPYIIRRENFKVTASTYENKLVALESGDTSKLLYGMAVDIGTTTIACYLVDMISGETLDTTSQVNKQRSYGADVISRINYTMENSDGVHVLKSLILDQINEMVELLCLNNKLSKDHIYNMTIAGNTVMLHMLLGISCTNIALAPYIPVFTDNMDFKGEELGINIGGIVSLLPGISAYVGSDIIAGILACGMRLSDKYSILLDLGTNGEIAFGNSDGVVACSTAAGPAFEGANIKHGIGGVKGAIAKIDFSKEKIYETIGDEAPLGICGSGVLDMVSELLKYEIIDETGRMVDAEEIGDIKLRKRLIIVDGMKQFLIEEKGENNTSIYFTQKDVREVQLAKAAINAGIKILISEKGISILEIENIYIAGGFGNFMNINSASKIGMIPRELEGKVCSIGNGAGSGAKMYLLSKVQKEETVKIKQVTKYIELSNRPDFQEYFMDAMMF